MSDLREGDLPRQFMQSQFITSQHMQRSDDIQDLVQEKFRSAYAAMTHVNEHGETLYIDMDTLVEREVETVEDFLRDGVMIRMSASAVFRLPRRSDLVEHVIDLRAYGLGSSFRSDDGTVCILMDSARSMVMWHGHKENGKFRASRYMKGRTTKVRTEDLPLLPLWQPAIEMAHEEILSGGYDKYGVPALHKVRVEDNIPMPLYGGAL